MLIASRTLVEDVLFYADAISEPGIINVPLSSLFGTWQNTGATLPYTESVGAECRFSFFGTGFNLRTFANAQGGMFEIYVNGSLVRNLSTWAATAGWPITNIVRGLPQQTHNVVMRFIGADPANAPSPSPARGYIARATAATPTGPQLESNGMVRVADLRDTFTTVHQLWAPESNAEIAIQARPVGEASAAQFWPKHTAAQVNTQIATRIYVDGTLLDTSALSANWADGVEVVCHQTSRGYHTAQPGSPWIECQAEHAINRTGAAYRLRAQILRDIEVSAAYAGMVPAQNCDRVLFDNGDTVDLTVHDGNMRTAPRNVRSGRMDDPVRHSYCLAFDLIDTWRSLRLGRAGSEPAWNRVMSRNDAGMTRPAKLYPYLTAQPATLPAGEVFEVAARVTGGPAA